MIGAGGAAVFVPLIRLAAHSLFGDDWRAMGAGVCGGRRCMDDCGGSSLLLGLSFLRRGGLFACGASSFPGGGLVMSTVPHCGFMRGRPGSCLSHSPGHGGAFPLLVRVRIMSRRGGVCVPVVGRPRRWICPGCLSSSSSSHHLVRRWRFRSRRPPPVCRLIHRCSLSPHRMRLSCGGRCLSSAFVSFSCELGKTAQDVIFFVHRPLMFPGFSSLRLACPSRGASRVFLSVVVGCSWRLVGRGRGVLRLSRGVALCLASFFACRLVPASRPPSRFVVSFSDVLRAWWCGVLARLVVVIHLVGRGFPCLPISSCRSPPSRGAGRRALLGGVSWRVVGGGLFVAWHWRVLAVSSCHRLVWRARSSSVSSWRLVHPLRGAVRFWLLFLSRRERMGGGSRLVRFVACACLSSLPAGGGCGDAVLIIGSSAFPACSLSSYGYGKAFARAGVPVWLVVACFPSSRSRLVSALPIRDDGAGGGTAGCLAIGAWSVVARRLTDIMNMMYAMYIKDTRIQGYENMMDI